MICPHCFKPIAYGIQPEIYEEARKLKEAGYSLRDISKILFAKGMQVSFSSLSRAFRGELKKVKVKK